MKTKNKKMQLKLKRDPNTQKRITLEKMKSIHKKRKKEEKTILKKKF